MQIYQIIPTIAYGDAVSNDTLALGKVMKEMGYTTKVYAGSIAPPYDHHTAQPIEKLHNVQKEDVIIFHLSTGSQLNFDVAEYECRKIVVYHNITPPEFFENNDNYIKDINTWGLEGVDYLKDKVDYCLADSQFNKDDLIRMGYECAIDVLPIVIPLMDYEKKPDRHTIRKFSDGYTNIIFTGRIAPNKKHESLISALYYYKRLYNQKSRLILVGSFKPAEIYYQRLQKYVERLGLTDQDVIFTGHIKFKEILAYYKVADVFLCMSEHEGFCVPLVEAMKFQIPILAYNTTAIPSTLGGSGMLIEDKDPVLIAGCIDRIVSDSKLRQQMIAGQNERLKDFEYRKIAEQFKDYLTDFLNR